MWYGVVRWTWLAALGILALSCGGRAQRPPGDDANGAPQSGSSGGPQGGSGAGDDGLPTTKGGAPSSLGGATAMPIGGSGSPPVLVGGGGAGGESACDMPWWGGTLEGVVGLHECPPPGDPALFAYGQSELRPCEKLIGPLEQRVADEALHCRYTYDTRDCGFDLNRDWWITGPNFGYGAPEVQIPESPVPSTLCSAPSGAPATLGSAAEHAALLHGVWLTCLDDGSTPFPGNAMAFLPDGSYRALQTDAQGRLSRAQGCDSTGLWGFFGGEGLLILYLNDQAFRTVVTFNEGTPRRLTFNDEGPEAHSPRHFVAVEGF